jgi:hypothetical protein
VVIVDQFGQILVDAPNETPPPFLGDGVPCSSRMLYRVSIQCWNDVKKSTHRLGH